MSRPRMIYDQVPDRVPAPDDGIKDDVGVPGFYRFRMRTGGVPVAVRIFFGPPREPWTGEELDRAPCWNAQVNGKWVDFTRVWPACAGDPITEAKARELEGMQRWAEKNGHEAMADPTMRLDPLSTPLMF